MSNINEKMKKLLEEKKKVSSQQGYNQEAPSKKSANSTKSFKSTKRGGSLNK